MTESDVVAVVGPAESSRKSRTGRSLESRGEMATIYEAGTNLLAEVGFGRREKNLTFRGLNIFCDDRELVLREILKLDSRVYLSFGFLVCLELGITLTGFHDDAEDDVAVTAFTKGVWGVEKDELKLFQRSKFL